jgi:hypothetical protein
LPLSKVLFSRDHRDWLLEKLREGDAEVLYPMAPDQTLLNYMVMRSGIPIYNVALNLPRTERTGNSVTSPHFQAEDHILYDRGYRLTYLHYIGISSKVFARICGGENLDIPYRDIFLHYRYLYEPDQRPQWKNKTQTLQSATNFGDANFEKIGI